MVYTGCPKKRTFRTEAASSAALAPVREAASVLKVRFFGTPCSLFFVPLERQTLINLVLIVYL